MPQRRSHFPLPAASSPASSKRTLSPRSSKSTPARQSKRLKSSPLTKTTPKKSPYFEHPTDSDDESEIDKEESGYEDEDASVVSSPPSSDANDNDDDNVSEEYASDSDEKPKKTQKKRGRKPGTKLANSTTTLATATKELWRPGVKSALAPGEAVYIPLPAARTPGKTPYNPSTLHPNTFLFLRDLRQHNDRDWLKIHDKDYRASLADWTSFVDELTPAIIDRDSTIPELPHKDLTFRIYRDVRFSSDPTPYKTHFSAAWSRTGRKGPYAGYYVQIQPGGSFVGAGVWHPEAGPMGLLRRAIDQRSERLKEVLMGEGMRREFFGGVKGEVKVVGKFVELNKEGALKTRPKGYDADNPNIALLRLRNYTIGKKLKDEEVVGKGALERIADLLGVLEPFVTYLNSVVMPDDETSSSDDHGNDEDDDDDDEVPEDEDGGEGDDDDDDEEDEPQ